MIRKLAAIGLLLALAACARSGAPAPVVDGNRGSSQKAAAAPATAATQSYGDVEYIVRRGDTVYAISRRFNVSVRRLIELNDFEPPYLLQVGQRVRVPVLAIHIVRRGDTLSEIADRYDIALNDLASANGIRRPYNIYVGQQIRLPRAVIAENPATAAPPPAPRPEESRPSSPAEPSPPPVAAENVVTEPTPKSESDVPAPRSKPITQASRAVPAPAPRSGKLLSWPVAGRILSEFGPKEGGLRNDGINIAMPRGAKVKAAENGVVAYAGDDIRAFGNLLLIKHADGLMTAYAHLERMLVKRGESVKRGQLIATVGSSGGVTTPQLHFEVRRKSEPVNPRKYLPKTIAALP